MGLNASMKHMHCFCQPVCVGQLWVVWVNCGEALERILLNTIRCADPAGSGVGFAPVWRAPNYLRIHQLIQWWPCRWGDFLLKGHYGQKLASNRGSLDNKLTTDSPPTHQRPLPTTQLFAGLANYQPRLPNYYLMPGNYQPMESTTIPPSGLVSNISDNYPFT